MSIEPLIETDEIQPHENYWNVLFKLQSKINHPLEKVIFDSAENSWDINNDGTVEPIPTNMPANDLV